jgi:hypothetical protein
MMNAECRMKIDAFILRSALCIQHSAFLPLPELLGYIAGMSISTDFPARGKVIRVEDSHVIFSPANTNYEIKLTTSGRYEGPVNTLIEGFVKAAARKVLTVPSGGNFVTPIFGPTRIVQGRIKYLDQTTMVVQAGLPVIVTLPAADSAYDLSSGQLALDVMVNATILPGASFQLAAVAV